MRKKLVFVISVIVLMLVSYFLDKKLFRNKRISRYEWEYSEGYYVGDFIDSDQFIISGDTLKFTNGRQALIKYQFLDFLILCDVAGDENGTYERMKLN